jgi:nickel/cobalt transporter (NiCoT) family protein
LQGPTPDGLLAGGGLLAPLFRSVTPSWHLYPIGLLFGLGFDTATEVGSLGIAAAQAVQRVSPWLTLVFPALFTAGMALSGTTDNLLMFEGYGWALVQPLRELWYNLSITAASVVVALLIGGIEPLALLADRLGVAGGIWPVAAYRNNDLTNFGFAMVGPFILAGQFSAIVYRWNGYHRVTPIAVRSE